MTLSDALDNILPFRKSRRNHGRPSGELDIQKFIAERQHGLTREEVDEIERRAMEAANIDPDDVIREMNAFMEQRRLKPVERDRDSA